MTLVKSVSITTEELRIIFTSLTPVHINLTFCFSKTLYLIMAN